MNRKKYPQNMRIVKMMSIRTIFILSTTLTILALILGAFVQSTTAQEPIDSPWSVPVNVSRSGAATNPRMLIFPDERIHLVWEDENRGLVQAFYLDEQWNPPVLFEPPFILDEMAALTDVRFLVDSGGRVHVFWRDRGGEFSYALMVGALTGENYTWGNLAQLSDSSPVMDAKEDALGNIHLVYINSEDSTNSPAGTYYRKLSPASSVWSEPILLHQSSYYAAATTDDSNIQLEVAGPEETPWVYTVWDNRPRRRVYMSKSEDTGETWTTPEVLDEPDPDEPSATPFNIRISATDSDAMVLWQVGDPYLPGFCTQAYRWSTDGGVNWTVPAPMDDILPYCADGNQFLVDSAEGLFLLTAAPDNAYLVAWDGTRWSNPQPQEILESFEDPEVFSTVKFRCRQAGLDIQDHLLVAGCDVGSGKDVWITDRKLESSPDWYPVQPVWTEGQEVSRIGDGVVELLLLADSIENMHALWTRRVDETAAAPYRNMGQAIVYNYWDGQDWQIPIDILRSPSGTIDQVSALIGLENRLLTVWRDGTSREILFSWANSSKAGVPSEWVNPIALSQSGIASSSPDIFVDNFGQIHVVFAVNLNEARGLYLTQSLDAGESWSEPVRIYDGVVNDWELVDYPRITGTGDGALHVIWTNTSVNTAEFGQALHYGKSEDGGLSWSSPETVSDALVSMNDSFGYGDTTIHHAWEQAFLNLWGVFHQGSPDSGAAWNKPDSIVSYSGIGMSRVVMDQAGQLHLVFLSEDNNGQQMINYWSRMNGEWLADVGLAVEHDLVADVRNISVSISPGGKLAVVYSGTAPVESNGVEEDVVVFSYRTLELPEPLESPQITTVPKATPTATLVPLIQPTATMEVEIATNPDDPIASSLAIDTNLLALIFGAVIAIFLVIVFIVVRVVRSR